MERMTTDVVKPPLAGGELPSFEELLAKGSFHARLAQARLKREKALAEGGGADDFILDTRHKPWDRDARGAEPRERLAAAVRMSVAVEAAAPAVAPIRPEPWPEPRPDAQSVSGRMSAKVVPLRQGDVFWLEAPVPAETAPAPCTPALTEAVAPVAAIAGAPAAGGSVAVRAAGGFLFGLMIGVAAMMALPAREVAVPVAAGSSRAPQAAPAPPSTASPSTASPAVTSPAAPQAVPQTAAETNPVVPAPVTALAAAALPARGLPLAEGPDAAPAARGALPVPGVPAGLDRLPGLALPGVTAAAGPGAAPRPDMQPEHGAVTLLATAVASDAPAAVQADPPPPAQSPAAPVPAAPVPVGPVIVNAPESIGEADLAGLVKGLGAAGFALAEPHRVDIPISESNVRFFHPEDAAAAQAVASRLGARLRDFTSFSPSPPAGTIEVWLAGHGNAAAAPARTRRTPAQRAATAEERELELLRDRILQQLRNGEHL